MSKAENNRTVVCVELNERGRLSVWLQAPNAGPRKAQSLRTGLHSFPAVDEPGTLREHGQALFEGPSKHRDVKQRMKDVMRVGGDQVYPLYFKTEGPGRDQLYWETLFKDQFLALDRRWPIARHVEPGRRTKLTRRFAPPLRMLAFLSALDNPAAAEWRALITAVRAAREAGLGVNLLVAVGEEKLLDDLEQEAAQTRDFSVFPMPAPAGVETMISEFQPQILHFFCHGREAMGTTSLELATITDRAQHPPAPSPVTLDMLKNLPALEDLWLVTLNCCESGGASNGLHSLAEGLVQEVAPAAVGWHEAVRTNSAHEFSRTFYADVLSWLARSLKDAEPGTEVRIEWAAHLHTARGALRDQHGGPLDSRDWALPVLYAPYGDLLTVVVYRPGGTDSDRRLRQRLAEADYLESVLDQLPPDTPDALRRSLRERRDAARRAAGGASQE